MRFRDDPAPAVVVTVPAMKRDTEGDLVGQRQWQTIHERHAMGQTISAIARELELDRKTVRTRRSGRGNRYAHAADDLSERN
jgi:DNA-binding NarL/FixJ family response regulator